MAIKINNDTVIDNDKNGKFNVVSLDGYTKDELKTLVVRGKKVGDAVYNTDKEELSFWDGTAWTDLPAETSGGNSTWREGGFTYHLFTTPGNFTTDTTVDIEVLVVAGGGGGGAGRDSGGGGAGGFQIEKVTVSKGTTPVVVGNGGAGQAFWPGNSLGNAHPSGTPGSPSKFGTLESRGGGSIRGYPVTPDPSAPYGSGYGGNFGRSPGKADGTIGQGYPGGNGQNIDPGPDNSYVCGGGGGAGGAGGNASSPQRRGGTGGKGYAISEFSGRSKLYPGQAWSIPMGTDPQWKDGVAGGGSGAGGIIPSNPGPIAADPIGGGGAGNVSPSPSKGGGDAVGYGGGGGGGGTSSPPSYNRGGGNGMPGVVVVRYKD